MTTAKHTPGPWRALPHQIQADDVGMVVAHCNHDFPSYEDSANMAHIVRCVNAHDDLVTALRDLIAAVATTRAPSKEALEAYERARAALAKAED